METLTTAGSLWAALLTLGPALGPPPPHPLPLDKQSRHLVWLPWFTLEMWKGFRELLAHQALSSLGTESVDSPGPSTWHRSWCLRPIRNR